MGDVVNAIILGVVQGLSEFLPISSTGHLILMREALSFRGVNELAFDAVLHLATALAVVVYFSHDIFRLFHVFLRMIGRQIVDEKDKVLLTALLVATVPGVVAGLMLEDLMETVFRSPLLVALVLVAGSGLFAYAEFVHSTTERKSFSVKSGFHIGLFQVLALVPGMSRSGATIAGGLVVGLTRTEATRFAFLMAVPIMLGAGGKKLFEIISAPGDVAYQALLAGAVTAFFVGLLAIHFMILFVRNHTLWPFIWYRIALAMVVLGFVFLGS